MKSLRIIGVIALIGVILSVVLRMSQPKVVHIEKSIFIKRSPEAFNGNGKRKKFQCKVTME
jgi:hypothetical protein